MSIYLLSYFIVFLSMGLKSNHLLMVLLHFEAFLVIVVGMLTYLMGLGIMGQFVLILFMVVMVCEGSLGLGLLVQLVRGTGSDQFCFFGLM